MSRRKLYAAFSLFRQMHEHPVEQTRPLRVARIQLLIGQFIGIRAAKRFSTAAACSLVAIPMQARKTSLSRRAAGR